MRLRHFLVFLAIFSACIGCGGGGPYDYVPVHGKVTYEDGSPISGGGIRLLFVALDAPEIANAHPRPGMANLNTEGEFDCVTSYKYGDGLIPGKHKVVIQASTEQSGRPLISAACASEVTTPLVIDTADVPLVIKVPKP